MVWTMASKCCGLVSPLLAGSTDGIHICIPKMQNWKILVYLMAIWYILWQFCMFYDNVGSIFCGNLICFMIICGNLVCFKTIVFLLFYCNLTCLMTMW
jgi:hypothetical protein